MADLPEFQSECRFCSETEDRGSVCSGQSLVTVTTQQCTSAGLSPSSSPVSTSQQPGGAGGASEVAAEVEDSSAAEPQAPGDAGGGGGSGSGGHFVTDGFQVFVRVPGREL